MPRRIAIAIPDKFKDRLRLVGTALYGRRWKKPLAVALGTSEQNLHRWCAGAGRREDIDARLVEVLDTAETTAGDLRRELSRYVVTQTARQRRKLARDRAS